MSSLDTLEPNLEPAMAPPPRWLKIYLLAVAFVSSAYGFFMARKASGWAIGEWLTNYSGGFIRRGLLGQVILLVSRALHLSPVWTTFAAQVAVYGVFLYCVYNLVSGANWTLSLAALVVSPATLAFIVLDPPAVFKKEILLFAALGTFILLLRKYQLRAWQVSALLTMIAAGLVLSHEPTLFYLPYFFAAVVISGRAIRSAVAIAIVPAVVALVAALAVSRHPGNLAMATAICKSVGGTMGDANQGLCSGSMMYLSVPFQSARYETAILMRFNVRSFVATYPADLLLTLLPVLLLLRRMWRNASQAVAARIIVVCAFVSFVGSSFLFLIALDWGRWIHMHAVCLLLLIVTSLHARQGQSGMVSSSVPAPRSPRLAIAAVLLYATCWNLPATWMYLPRFGYLDVGHWFWRYAHHEPTTDYTPPPPA